MPCQYSWSCKRSYKNGYVWNDLTENDAIYATEGSEYVLKGSEIMHDRDFSEMRLEEVQNKRRQQRNGSQVNSNGMVMNKSVGIHQGGNYRQLATRNRELEAIKNYDQTENHNDDDEEEEEEDEKGSCNSSNAPYPTMQIEQEESYSLPSTSSTNSDKQQPLPAAQVAKTSSASESKRSDKDAANKVFQEDGDPTVSTSLARNSTVLLHLIACGEIVSPQGKDKAKEKADSVGGSSRNFNFSMKNGFMPCLKQQLSTRGVSSTSANAIPPLLKGGVTDQRHDDRQVVSKQEEDEDMMMVRYMSENPRFGNLQSEEEEYFSGTIVEAMSTHHQQNNSTCSASSQPPSNPPPVLAKSSSYNEQWSSKAGLQATASQVEDADDEKEDAKVKGIIKLCIPRKKSFSSTSTKHT